MIYQVLFFISSTWAAPQKYSDCPDLSMISNSGGAYFSEDCKTAYVLPPAVAKISVSTISPSQNLKIYCPLIESISAQAEFAQSQIDQITRHEDSGYFGENTQPLTPEQMEHQWSQMQQVNERIQQIRALIRDYDKIPGATATVLINTNMPKLLDRYRQRHRQIQFVRMPLKNARVELIRPELSDVPMQSLIDVSFGNPNRFSSGTASGQMTLSLFSACGLFRTHGQRPTLRGNPTRALGHFAINLRYEYELQTERKYQASFNLGQLARRVKSRSNRGGLIHASTLNRMVIDQSDQSWFSLSLTSQDGNYGHEELAAELKAQIIDRYLPLWIQHSFGQSIPEPELIAPRPNGISRASSALNLCRHKYCRFGAHALNIFGASNGSDSAIDQFIRDNDFNIVEKVDEQVMLPFYGSVAYQ